MENVKQMLSAIETNPPDTDDILASVTFETVAPDTQAFRTRVTAMFVGEFSGAGGVSRIVFILDDQFLAPAFNMNAPNANPDPRSRTFLVFSDGVPSGQHRLSVKLQEARPPAVTVGIRTLTVWETVMPRDQPGPDLRGAVIT
jgi:hypothetical protein